MQKIFKAWANRWLQKLVFKHKKWIAVTQYQRARRVVGRSGGLMRGKFPSAKNQRMVHWESQLERDAIFLFEYSPAVWRYREQPFTTHYVLEDRTYRYTPDFELAFVDGSKLIVEVKPAIKLQRPDLQKKFDRITEHFSLKGQQFRILTDIEIRQPQLQENLRLIQRYRRPPLSAFDRRLLFEKLRAQPIPSFSAIAQLLGSPSDVWALLGDKILNADLRLPIDESTIFEINFEGRNDANVYF